MKLKHVYTFGIFLCIPSLSNAGKMAEAFSIFSNTGLASLESAYLGRDVAGGFGRDMAKKYSKIHSMPKCPNSPLAYGVSIVDDDGKKWTSTGEYCYPNTELKHGNEVEKAFFMTGTINQPAFKHRVNWDDPVSNAARHAYLFCFIAAKSGYDKANSIANKHELYAQGDGIEDAHADQRNNEIGMRYGNRLYKLYNSKNPKYSKKAENVIFPHQRSQTPYRYWECDVNLSTDPKDLALIDINKHRCAPPNEKLRYNCKRFIERVIRGEIYEGQVQLLFMTHRPGVDRRLTVPVLKKNVVGRYGPDDLPEGAAPESRILYPIKYSFPKDNSWGGTFNYTDPTATPPIAITGAKWGFVNTVPIPPSSAQGIKRTYGQDNCPTERVSDPDEDWPPGIDKPPFNKKWIP